MSENFHLNRENLYFCDERDRDIKIQEELKFYIGREVKINYLSLPSRTRDVFNRFLNLRGDETYKITHAWFMGNKVTFELEESVNNQIHSDRESRTLYLLKGLVTLLPSFSG